MILFHARLTQFELSRALFIVPELTCVALVLHGTLDDDSERWSLSGYGRFTRTETLLAFVTAEQISRGGQTGRTRRPLLTHRDYIASHSCGIPSSQAGPTILRGLVDHCATDTYYAVMALSR